MRRKEYTAYAYFILLAAAILILVAPVSAAPAIAQFTMNVTSDNASSCWWRGVHFFDDSTCYGGCGFINWCWTYSNVTGPDTTRYTFSTSAWTDLAFPGGNWSIIGYSQNNSPAPNWNWSERFVNVSYAYDPVASFTYTPVEGMEPLYVNFTDTSTGCAWDYRWNRTNLAGSPTNQTFSYAMSPNVSFSVGNWTIQLYVNNSVGNDTTTGTYFVNSSYNPETPVASFTANVTSGMIGYWGEPVAVAFNDTSVNATQWYWTLRDGSVNISNATVYWMSSQQNPTYSFYAGTWVVVLNVSNALGTNGSAPMTITVTPWSQEIAQSQYYTTKKVRFVAHDFLGKPIVNMNVSVIGVESSLGSLDWLPYLFGINLNNTPLLDTYMNATTGSDGAVAFVMVETEKYELHYVSAALGIDEKRYYYPKEEEYLEVFWTESSGVLPTQTTPGCGKPVYTSTVTVNGSNPDYTDIYMEYSDCSGLTTNMTVYVTNNKNKQVVYRNVTTNPNSFSVTVPVHKGSAYNYGITGRAYNNISYYQDSLLKLNVSIWRYNPLNAADNDLFAGWLYNILAVAFLVMFGFLFGRWSIKAAVVAVPLIGLFFSIAYMNWLQTGWLLVSVAVVLGVMVYLRFAEEEAQL